MYYKEEIISYLQSNNILALKLDHALTGTADFVSAFYSTLYANELEMLYFLVEPLFVRAQALNAERASDTDIANIIKRMTG